MIHFNYQYDPLFSSPMNNEITAEDENELNATNFTPTNLSNYPFRLSKIISFDINENICPDSILEEEKRENEKDKIMYISSKENLVEKKGMLINKKRGRKRKKINKFKIHDKNSSDNLLRKIQVHYISFIISFINEILKNLKYEERFFKLDYKFKFNINKKFVESLKTKNIGEIISNEISKKYKEDSNYNKKIYEQIKENEVLKKIFSENYLVIFRKFYYQNKDKINLSEYGLDKKIKLSKKVEMFNDLYNKINSKNQYTKNIKDFVLQKYFSPPKFEVIKEASNKHL